MTKSGLNTGIFDIFSLCRVSGSGMVLLITTLFFLKCLSKSDRCIIEPVLVLLSSHLLTLVLD